MPLVVALIGLFFPNALFLYWFFFELDSARALWQNHAAIALFVDAVLATSLLAYLFALRPTGKIKWPWLFVFTLIGGMGFGIGILLWINYKTSPTKYPDFRSWWRSI